MDYLTCCRRSRQSRSHPSKSERRRRRVRSRPVSSREPAIRRIVPVWRRCPSWSPGGWPRHSGTPAGGGVSVGLAAIARSSRPPTIRERGGLRCRIGRRLGPEPVGELRGRERLLRSLLREGKDQGPSHAGQGGDIIDLVTARVEFQRPQCGPGSQIDHDQTTDEPRVPPLHRKAADDPGMADLAQADHRVGSEEPQPPRVPGQGTDDLMTAIARVDLPELRRPPSSAPRAIPRAIGASGACTFPRRRPRRYRRRGRFHPRPSSGASGDQVAPPQCRGESRTALDHRHPVEVTSVFGHDGRDEWGVPAGPEVVVRVGEGQGRKTGWRRSRAPRGRNPHRANSVRPCGTTSGEGRARRSVRARPVGSHSARPGLSANRQTSSRVASASRRPTTDRPIGRSKFLGSTVTRRPSQPTSTSLPAW